ncbi:MAG: LarC family nickel insertion protein [Desulfovibrio sp.]|jgi:uncharacterized protein (DUF111 family)|nr:LarC family nickel insertion protein [Desulfovibrio sp.]
MTPRSKKAACPTAHEHTHERVTEHATPEAFSSLDVVWRPIAQTHEYTQAHEHMPDHGQGHIRPHGSRRAARERISPDEREDCPVPEDKAACGGKAVLTVRALSGLSGDIMLGGLAALAGFGNEELNRAVAGLNIPLPENCVRLEERSVNGVTGVGCRISLPHEHTHRTFRDIESLIAASSMPDEAKVLSLRAFALLATAEGAVHGQEAETVTFHEVGALDSILDACLCCSLFARLKPARFVCSPLPLADGSIRCAHGLLPSPAPAVLRLLEGVAVRAFPCAGETVTPTALSLLKAMGADFGPWPEMTVQKTVISYGSKVFADVPNGALWALGRGAA